MVVGFISIQLSLLKLMKDQFKWTNKWYRVVETTLNKKNHSTHKIYLFQENMESVFAQVVAAAKLPMLNLNEFELCKMRIEQYFLMTDYALWEVILNGDSPLPTRTVDGVETSVPPTAEQKIARKNDLKAREGLDQIYDRLQKLISQLEIHGETISQEDLNLELLRSLPSEWKTHTLIWRNKLDLETLSMDDLYNNLKIYEAKVMRSSSISQNTQNVAFVSSNINGSTNEVVKTAHGVFAANSKPNASTLPNVDSLSDAVIYSFFVKNRLEVADGNANNESKEISQEDMKEFRAPKNQDSRNREPKRRTVQLRKSLIVLVSQFDGLAMKRVIKQRRYKEIDIGFVAFGGNSKGGKITGKDRYYAKQDVFAPSVVKPMTMLGSGPTWLFDNDTLTKSMNYKPVIAGNQSNGSAGTKACDNAGKARVETVPGKDYIPLPFLTQDLLFSSSLKDSLDAGFKPSGEEEMKDTEDPENEDNEVPNTKEPRVNQEKDKSVNSTNNINTISSTINTASIEDNAVDENLVYGCDDDPNMPNLEEIIYSDDDEGVSVEADMTNLDTHILVSLIPTTKIHKDHPVEQIIRDIHSAPQTRRMTKNVIDHGMLSSVQLKINHKDFQNCLFACFLSQAEPKKVIQALKDPSWIEAMQEEALPCPPVPPQSSPLLALRGLLPSTVPSFHAQLSTVQVTTDERGIVIKNKARLVIQGYTQEKGIDYDEVFAPVARIEAIRLFLAYALFKDFVVYQMDMKSAFMYGKIKEEVYVCQPLGFEDPEFPDRVYKVEKAYKVYIKLLELEDILLVQVYVDDIIFGSIRKELCTEFEKMMHKKFQMSSIGELTIFLGLQVTQKDDGIFISQDKYVDEILKKFGFLTVKTASTPMETSNPLIKDENAEDVDVYLYRLMIGSLMYLTSSRPDIMFAVCACAIFHVTPKVSHLHAVKRIFRY
ncbi:putative ribonuclease H-like domain-containing protein [Tanacetum coccineum]